MAETLSAQSAVSFIPRLWSEALLDYVSADTAFLADGPQCMWWEDWATAVTADGERFRSSDDVKIVLLDGGEGEFQGSKVVTRDVPDAAAQADLRALLDKWTAEGKDDLVSTLSDAGCYECSSTASIFGELTHSVTKTVTRRAPVNRCTFFRAGRVTFNTADSVGVIDVSTHQYEAFGVSESDATV